MNINLLDLILLIPLLLFGFNGFRKGIIIEITTLIALVFGLYAAIYFSDYTAGLLKDSFEIGKDYLTVVSFVVTFIVVLFLVLLLGKILEKIVNILMLGFLNKLVGALFGILKGALLLSIFIFLINFFDEQGTIIKKNAKEKSVLYRNIEPMAPWLYNKLNLKKLKKELPKPEEILNI